MTFCLALAVPNISLVVADTRVNLELDPATHMKQDGPKDFTISVTNPRYEVTAPFRFRKIRPVSDGWVTSAGDYLLGRDILDLIADHAKDSFTYVNRLLLTEYPRIKHELQKRTGFSDEQVSGTVIMGAPFASQPSAWLISFDQSRAETNPAIGNYVTNWPPVIPTEVQRIAQDQFLQQLQIALSERSIPAIARSLIRLVETAAKYSDNVGNYAQFGITVSSSSAKQESYYLEGLSVELLSMSNSQLETRLERLTKQ